jgi:quinol monooxygenase YgiN
MIYALTIFAKPGADEAIAQLVKEGATAAQRAPGCLSSRPLLSLGDAPAEDEVARGPHLIWIEEWETKEARAAHRATDAFREWFQRFTALLLPEPHTHDWYREVD